MTRGVVTGPLSVREEGTGTSLVKNTKAMTMDIGFLDLYLY